MIVLGIDPGSRRTGYSIIERGRPGDTLLECGVIDLTDTDDHNLSLARIFSTVTQLIEEQKPDECAVEMPVYGRNPQSMLKLGRAQAAAILAALNRQIPVFEYAPKEVKKAVTGVGSASKEQVRSMVCSILRLTSDAPLPLDASDAIAVGLCHLNRPPKGRIDTKGRGKKKGWSSYVSAHPDRVASDSSDRSEEKDR